ncbi:MAG: hypothetical protein KF831_03245 [Acidobacteria bacterium]|nr:hypothetical protein [Acidobacteriota bacterium]
MAILKITIDNKGFEIEGKRLVYDLYYFESDQYDGPTLAHSFAKVLVRWAEVLQRESVASGVLLPFALDDHYTECLKAVQIGRRIILKYVVAAVAGFQIDVEDIEDFMTSPQDLESESSEIFGDYDKEEFIAALLNPKLIVSDREGL